MSSRQIPAFSAPSRSIRLFSRNNENDRVRILPGDLNGAPADQKSIDLPELQRRTIQQARSQSLLPMKYDAGMDPNMGIFDRIGEKAGQDLATVAANLPRWSSAGQMRPFATDAEVEARRDQPVENALQTYLAHALHMPEAILVGSSLGGGVPGWINSARSTGAPAATGSNRAFSKIGSELRPSSAAGTEPSPTLATLYPGPTPLTQPSQTTSLGFPSTTAGSEWTPRLAPFAPTWENPDPTQPATTPAGAASLRRILIPSTPQQ